MGLIITIAHRVRLLSSTNLKFENEQRGKLAIRFVDSAMANNEATQTAEVEGSGSMMSQPSVHGSIDTML
jgi:hypothetical protein